jgi:hypothetical protein
MMNMETYEMWTKFRVEMNFLTKLVSSVPADPELVKKWLDARKPTNRPPDSKSIDEVAAEVMATLPDEIAESGMNVFQRQEGGLVVRISTIRAHLKDCARTLSRLYVGKIEGEKSFAVKVVNALYYPPEIYWLPILNQEDGQQMREPTGQYDKAIHAMTPRGSISALKRFEYVENARLVVPIIVLTPEKGRPVVGLRDLTTLFEYGSVHGYAGERSDGEGRYVAIITQEN